MCIGIPMQVAEAAGPGVAWCERRGERLLIDMRLVGDAAAGSWVLVFQHAARELLDESRARDIASAIEGLEAALAGDGDLDRHFADIIGREPELPEHLRKELNRA
ncbi:MAG: HypC/HybG/HupF family hydrogenase formation chaperone [Steroidobacteraceae bacterium]|jgi:hydrogenase expression/formation protein HypC|nr:HypC/HybG/HupF family hydrogenase formation chaperone [Steroidobacteraceae bacterium]